jgi:hypothetical protein
MQAGKTKGPTVINLQFAIPLAPATSSSIKNLLVKCLIIKIQLHVSGVVYYLDRSCKDLLIIKEMK